MSTWTIVVAGGSGRRFGGPKQLSELAGKRVLDWACLAARRVSDGLVVVVPDDLLSTFETVATDTEVVVAAGGDSRSASVRSGLQAVPDDATVILVHDAARPLATDELFERVAAAVRGGAEAVVPVIPVADSIRTDDGPVDRGGLHRVQTPQGFAAAALRASHTSGNDASDDATLVEANGGAVTLVVGEETNLKLTTPTDLTIARAMLRERQATDG